MADGLDEHPRDRYRHWLESIADHFQRFGGKAWAPLLRMWADELKELSDDAYREHALRTRRVLPEIGAVYLSGANEEPFQDDARIKWANQVIYVLMGELDFAIYQVIEDDEMAQAVPRITSAGLSAGWVGKVLVGGRTRNEDLPVGVVGQIWTDGFSIFTLDNAWVVRFVTRSELTQVPTIREAVSLVLQHYGRRG